MRRHHHMDDAMSSSLLVASARIHIKLLISGALTKQGSAFEMMRWQRTVPVKGAVQGCRQTTAVANPSFHAIRPRPSQPVQLSASKRANYVLRYSFPRGLSPVHWKRLQNWLEATCLANVAARRPWQPLLVRPARQKKSAQPDTRNKTTQKHLDSNFETLLQPIRSLFINTGS